MKIIQTPTKVTCYLAFISQHTDNGSLGMIGHKKIKLICIPKVFSVQDLFEYIYTFQKMYVDRIDQKQ